MEAAGDEKGWEENRDEEMKDRRGKKGEKGARREEEKGMRGGM